MTTTEDNKDQGALEAIADALLAADVHADADDDVYYCSQVSQRILSALAEAGYTVVKTGWEYGFGMPVDGRVHAGFQVRKDPYSKDQIADLNKTYTVPVIGVRRRKAGPWEPVPEGGEQ